MRPLTDQIPKPLLKVKGKPLIEHALERIVATGITEVVINTAYRGQQIEDFLQDGSTWGAHIHYSPEGEPLETGGGIARAMPLLCTPDPEPFLLINSDVWSDIDLSRLLQPLPEGILAHLVLVANPEHHPHGDFFMSNGVITDWMSEPDSASGPTYTYSGIAVIHPELITRYAPDAIAFPLLPLLQSAIVRGQVTAELHAGVWVDVGTPERLAQLNR